LWLCTFFIIARLSTAHKQAGAACKSMLIEENCCGVIRHFNVGSCLVKQFKSQVVRNATTLR
jgi:hypothetical protein